MIRFASMPKPATLTLGLTLALLWLHADAQEPAAEASTIPDVVNAASLGFDAEDATECLQAAIDSGAAKVIVPYMATPWIVRPITLRSALELVFEPGVVVLAKRGEFKGKGDCLFKASDAQDITLRGYGAVLRMWKEDYQSEAYDPAEWRMGLSFLGCRRIRIEGLRIEDSGGDGIYLGATANLTYCSDVIIRDVVCDGHHRQGISVITAVNLLIENCVLSNTDGTAPQAGIDFEPNNSGEKMANCIVRNCLIEGNSGSGILVYLKQLNRETSPVSIECENCLIRGNTDAGISVGAVKDDGPQGAITFRNCTVENSGEAGMYVYDKSADSARVRFENCKWGNTWTGGAGHDGPRIPLMINLARSELTTRPGGIGFVDCQVYDDEDRPVIVFEEKDSEHGLFDVSGDLVVHNPHGATTALGDNQTGVILKVVQAE